MQTYLAPTVRLRRPLPWMASAAAMVTVFALTAAISPRPLAAQQISSIPSAAYFDTLSAYQDGDLTGSLRRMRSVIAGNMLGRSSLELICYHALAGECFYELGDLSGAMEQYTAALRAWQSSANFMLRCTYPAEQLTPAVSVVRPPITWAGRTRRAVRVRMPGHFFISVGGLANFLRGQNGELAIAPQTTQFRIEGLEILRCTALAMRRRAELLGPLAKHDQLTSTLTAAFGQPLAPPNHYSNAWVRLLSGLSLIAAERPREAAVELNASLMIGNMDHALTCVALIELGKLAQREGAIDQAGQMFLEATFTAAEHQQWTAMAEAFRYGMLAHLERGDRTVWAPLAAATAWSSRARASRTLSVSLWASLAENLAAAGKSAEALAVVEQARRDAGRRSVLQGMAGGRLLYQAALAGYQLGNGAAADKSLASAMPVLVKGSRWNYQAALADQLYTRGAIGGRAATTLYEQLLRDPGAKDWLREPHEALAALLAPTQLAMEHWFELALDRKEFPQALEISDLARRRRFFQSLPLGGRLVALRWIAEAPSQQLSDQALKERQQLQNTRPAYAQLSKQAIALRQQLAALPLDAEGEDRKQQEKAAKNLEAVSQQQEFMLRAFALDRVPSELVFPPKLDADTFQQQLKDKQALLAYFATSKQVYGFAVTKNEYFTWKVASPRAIRANLSSLLKHIGCRKPNSKLPPDQLTDTAWKEDAEELRKGLFPEAAAGDGKNVWDAIEELVIVPDGVLWYLPFELLPHSDANTDMVIDRKQVRYTPLISLAWPKPMPRPVDLRTAIVAQRVSPEDTVDQAKAAAKVLADARGGVAIWDLKLPASSATITSVAQQLIVWSNLPDTPAKSVHLWSPMLLDRRQPGSTMLSWLSLPWGGPRAVALPGFHTPAESAIGGRADGSDLFLTACALMADGTRTAIISRWTVGGQSTRDIIREAMQELPHTTATRAWQRAVQLHRVKKIDPQVEPRLTPSGELVSGDHPLLWASYLLIDTGEAPRKP